MSVYKVMKSGGLEYIVFKLFDNIDWIVHAFSTRNGGVSKGPYKSLNLGIHVGDSYENVLENRARFARSVGVNPQSLVSGAQVHGDKVQLVSIMHKGRGAESDSDALPGVDALVTNLPGLPLTSYYGDCVPVFLLDPLTRVIALAHAGWKGTVLRIAQKTVLNMHSRYNCKPENCLAVIGPSIGQCCYEVDNQVINRLRLSFPDWNDFAISSGEGRWKLNLAALNKKALIDAGLVKDNIVVADLCTSCNKDLFFSHRSSGGHTGRMASIIMIKS